MERISGTEKKHMEMGITMNCNVFGCTYLLILLFISKSIFKKIIKLKIIRLRIGRQEINGLLTFMYANSFIAANLDKYSHDVLLLCL